MFLKKVVVVGAVPSSLPAARNWTFDLILKRNIAMLISKKMTNLHLVSCLARLCTCCTKSTLFSLRLLE